MQSKLYNLTFRGEITGQFPQDTVIRNLAVLFKKDPQTMAKLFTGDKFTLSRDLGMEAAQKYQALLKKAGAVVKMEEQGIGQTQKAGSALKRTPGAAIQATIAPVGSLITETVQVEEPEIDITGISMSEPGVTIVEHAAVARPVINTDSFSLSPSGSDLVERAEMPVFDKPVGQYDLAPPGEILSNDKRVNKADRDTSKLPQDSDNP